MGDRCKKMKLQKLTEEEIGIEIGLSFSVFLILIVGLSIPVHAFAFRSIECLDGDAGPAYAAGYKDAQLGFLILHGNGYDNSPNLKGDEKTEYQWGSHDGWNDAAKGIGLDPTC